MTKKNKADSRQSKHSNLYPTQKLNIHIEVCSSSRVSIDLYKVRILTRPAELDLAVTSPHHLNAVNVSRQTHDVISFTFTESRMLHYESFSW